jgi:hypothetical protein
VSFAAVPSSNEMALQAVVALVGPVSVSINAGLPSFHHYKEGEVNPNTLQPIRWEIHVRANQIT